MNETAVRQTENDVRPASGEPTGAEAPGWTLVKLTDGTPEGRCHSHSYYDIPAFDARSRFIASHRLHFAGRQPEPDDTIDIGIADTEAPLDWMPLGQSRAWSWQQGPMAQFVPGTSTLVWNDREGERFVARRHSLDDDEGTSVGGAPAATAAATSTLPRPVYALSPDGRFALSLNMARLEGLRPGYGYAGGADARLDEARPADEGVWRMPLDGGDATLVLSLDEACRFLFSRLSWLDRQRHRLARHVYWFNHVKVSPDGARFTVKLRWRAPGKGWNETQGVSLTCACDGGEPSLLARASSHVIWENPGVLYLWRDGSLGRYADEAPEGRPLGELAPRFIDANVHIRRLPGDAPEFVFDTPYRETIELNLYDEARDRLSRLATFTGHTPVRGPFRCDLHPCPSPDGDKIVVTSPMDGGRQVHILRRDE